MYLAGIITSSDRCSSGQRNDESGLVIKEILENYGYKVERYVVLPDEYDMLISEMIKMSDELMVNLIITTGGTGFSPRDVTPEATIAVCDKMVPGISEAIRNNSMNYTKRAMLSRAVSGIRNRTLIINLPGSPKAVKESLEFIIDTLEHGLEILAGKQVE